MAAAFSAAIPVASTTPGARAATRTAPPPPPPALELSQEDLRRHGRLHAGAARRAGRDLRRRPRADGHRLPLRHGGIRSARASRCDEEPRRDRGRGDRRWQRTQALGNVSGSTGRDFLALAPCRGVTAAAKATLPMPAVYRILRHFFPAMIEPGAVR